MSAVRFLMCCLLAMPGQATAPAVIEINPPATLLVTAPQDKDGVAMALADVLTVTLEVQGARTFEVKASDPITHSSGWRLVEASPGATVTLADALVRWRQSYTLEPLGTGNLELQIEPLLVREETGEFRKLTWRPITVAVSTNFQAPDLKDIRDPTVIEAIPAEPATALHLWWVWGGSGALLAALLWLYKRRRSLPHSRGAEEGALRELDRLEALHLPERGKVERFHTLLALLMRRYLERKYHLPARRRTTPEFLRLMHASHKLVAGDDAFLQDFLRRCDLAKFAGEKVGVEDCHALAGQARAFLVKPRQANNMS